jgi:hypothetical protein
MKMDLLDYFIVSLVGLFFVLSFQVGYAVGNSEKKVRSCKHHNMTYIKIVDFTSYNPEGNLYLCKRCELCGKYTEELVVPEGQKRDLYRQVGQLLKETK